MSLTVFSTNFVFQPRLLGWFHTMLLWRGKGKCKVLCFIFNFVRNHCNPLMRYRESCHFIFVSLWTMIQRNRARYAGTQNIKFLTYCHREITRILALPCTEKGLQPLSFSAMRNGSSAQQQKQK